MSSLQSTELFQHQAYINGQWLAAQSNATVPLSNPATGEEIGTIPNTGAAETTQAIEAAYTALQSWKALTAQNRADFLLAWPKLVLDPTDALALIITLAQGKPLADAKGEVRYAASFIQWVAEEG
ncbi:aldehyde dehydrogenase family protein, partial [Acinetobacter baumannii]|uniref:aldehyde dehydrogenase family protein n=1 Tax=Acinetobacter baumannii TaxID=470 RepID=UPI001146E4FF